MTYDRPLLGIFLMIGFCVLMPVSDAIAKFLSPSIPLGLLLLVRFSMQALLLLPFVYPVRKSLPISWPIFKLVLIRTFLQIIGIGAMFLGLRFLPLADALAIAFVMPFIMLLLGKYVLGEQVGKHRLLACVVGFIGTWLVIQPNFASVGAPALLPLIVAVVFALFMLVTRKIAKEINPVNLQAISGLLATLAIGFIYIVVPTHYLPGFELIMPDFTQGVLLGLTGAIGTIGHLLMTWSLRFAPSATLAPMQYIEIPAATVVGWLVFKDLPNGMAALGIAITMGAGLYAILRENRWL
jgi:drug/metabolite transporter (DMT)-like permease